MPCSNAADHPTHVLIHFDVSCLAHGEPRLERSGKRDLMHSGARNVMPILATMHDEQTGA